MSKLQRCADMVKRWVEEIYHHARGHTLLYIHSESTDDNNELGFSEYEFDGWAQAIYKDADGNLCVDDLDGDTHLFKFSDVTHFMIGD